ncbi:unnamed protein product [Aphanomyces euteiches]
MNVTKHVHFDEETQVISTTEMGNKSSHHVGSPDGHRRVPPPPINTHEISVQPPSLHKSSSSLDLKLIEAFKELKARKEREGADKHDPFTKILLKGPSLKQAFNSVRSTFEEFDRHKKGSIDFADMEEALNRLGGNFTQAEINEAFSEADMEETGHLTFKEFLVCLAIGFVLHRIPVLEEQRDTEMSIFYAPLKGSADPKTLLFGEGNKLRQAFQLAVDVFLWFDMDGDGLIEKRNAKSLARIHARAFTDQENVEAVPTFLHSRFRGALTLVSDLGVLEKKPSIEEAACPANAFITQRRFNEMDWDHDGSITFKARIPYGIRVVG